MQKKRVLVIKSSICLLMLILLIQANQSAAGIVGPTDAYFPASGGDGSIEHVGLDPSWVYNADWITHSGVRGNGLDLTNCSITIYYSVSVNTGLARSGTINISGEIFTVYQEGIDNQPPTANAGTDQTVFEEETVVLDGSNSFDPDDGIVAYQWWQISGPSVTLSNATAVQPTFTAPDVSAEGVALTFELTVTDSGGLTDTDTCTVNVTWNNVPPTANAGPVQTVAEETTVTLDGSNSFDPDDGIAAYQWRQTSGPSVTLSNATAVQPSFLAPDVNADGAALTFELTVTDLGGLVDTDTCTVNVTWNNIPPTANAGPVQAVAEETTVTLDGSNSFDPDDGIAGYQWRQTVGPSVTLSNATAVQPTFTAPDVSAEGVALTFELTVTDSGGLVDTDTCSVNIENTDESSSGGFCFITSTEPEPECFIKLFNIRL